MPHEPSPLLHAVEIIHWAALAVMALVYTLRIRWLLRFKAGRDLSAPGAPQRTNPRRAAWYSLGNVAMPWSMESTRAGRGLAFWVSFVVFHLGVAVGIALAFLSTVARGFVTHPAVVPVAVTVLAAAFAVGLYRIARRTLRPVLRLVSTPDDYFSLALLVVWLGLGVLTELGLAGVPALAGEGWLVAYLLLTSFFLLYVPFSKISHYLYYPFTRVWIGRALGHRGSMPLVRG